MKRAPRSRRAACAGAEASRAPRSRTATSAPNCSHSPTHANPGLPAPCFPTADGGVGPRYELGADHSPPDRRVHAEISRVKPTESRPRGTSHPPGSRALAGDRGQTDGNSPLRSVGPRRSHQRAPLTVLAATGNADGGPTDRDLPRVRPAQQRLGLSAVGLVPTEFEARTPPTISAAPNQRHAKPVAPMARSHIGAIDRAPQQSDPRPIQAKIHGRLPTAMRTVEYLTGRGIESPAVEITRRGLVPRDAPTLADPTRTPGRTNRSRRARHLRPHFGTLTTAPQPHTPARLP